MAETVDLTAFRDLPDLAWANLMLGGTALPALPPDQLQRNWCGNAGAPLAQQSAEFYQLVKACYGRHARKPLSASRLLDFGCGWGRLTRLFAKDLPPDRIFGCDSDPAILEWCQSLPGTFRQSETKLRKLPFDERFDLIFAFSVFTHLGPKTHDAALDALHAALAADGLAILTVRPRGFIDIRGAELASLPDDTLRAFAAEYDKGNFVYHPYNLPAVDGEVPYGEAVIPLAYIKKHWAARFEIVELPRPSPSDPYQIPVVLRRR